MSVPSFSAEKIFRDPQNFPYGFARSGELWGLGYRHRKGSNTFARLE